MASKVADGLHKLVAGGLITISAAGVGAIGWGVYSLYVLRPAHLKAQSEAISAEQSAAPAQVVEVEPKSTEAAAESR